MEDIDNKTTDIKPSDSELDKKRNSLKEYTVDVIIPTYKPDDRLINNIKKLQTQTYPVNKNT